MRNTFCLQSVSSFKDINSSPLNRSTSKNLWSFSKDSRFKKPTIYCDSFYQKPSTFRRRGASIGYGTKSDFTKDLTCSPGSSRYKLDTIFDSNKKQKRGSGFSHYPSRQQIKQKGYIPLDPLRVPAPNKYQNLKAEKGLSYSMKARTRTIDKTMSIQSQNSNPGAGTYQNPQAMSPRGYYQVSKHKGTGATLFNPRRSQRFFQFQNEVPGPGQYNQINALSDRGHYPLTSSNGFGKRYFDKQKRVVQFQQMAKTNYIPGVGSYRLPSDFGQYDGDVYRRSPIINRSSRVSSKNKL